jgi:hypothetical protein
MPFKEYDGQKTCDCETPSKGNYFLLKKAYFADPGRNPGIFCGGGHFARTTLFTRLPEGKTGLNLGLFSSPGDEILPGR